MDDSEKMIIRESMGGINGHKFIIMIGDKYVGYFYQDASEGIDAEDVLMEMAEAWNRANA
jgi:hypothetical protein